MPSWAKWLTWAKWGEAGSAAATYSISGTINDSAGAGLDGVTVTLTGDASDSVVTAGGGAYEFTGLDPGSYTLTPTKAGSTFNPTSAAVTIVATNKTATTMAQVWAVSGQILDGSGAGLSGALVTLSGDASDTDTTDGSGNYSFPALADGSYTVTPTKAGSTFNPTSRASTISGADDAVSSMAQVWQITGTIEQAGVPIEGVLVTLTGDASDTDTTDSSGDYTFPGLSDGSYTVTPTKTNYTFAPTDSAESVSGGDESADFEGTAIWPLSINMEGIANGITDLSAYASFFSPDGSGTRQVNVDDYLNLPVISGSPVRDLDKAWYVVPTAWQSGSFSMFLGIGNGWTPSDNGTARIEVVVYSSGVNASVQLFLLSDSANDGIKVETTGSNIIISTKTGGSWTVKYNQPFWTNSPWGSNWFVFSFEYNFSTNAIDVSARGLGSTGVTQERPTYNGTVSSPTFDADTELHKVYCTVTKEFEVGGECVGHSQLWVGDGTTALPDGYKVIRNFVP